MVPFTNRLPRLWGDLEREMASTMRSMLDWDGNNGDLASFTPSMNVAETESGYEVTLDLPGTKPEEVNVEFKDDALWITGSRNSETEDTDKTYHRVERSYGSFRRVIRLGTDVNPESIDASFSDGVLKITATKSESARPKKIEIHT
jgi:HSP20 family protein